MFERDPATATIGEEILPFEIDFLPEFFQKKGEAEIHFTQTVRENTLREFREAIAGDDILNGIPITDECLLAFLTCRKFDVDKAFKHLKKSVTFKSKNNTMFKIPSFDVLSVFMTTEFITVLPWRCQDGCALVLIQLGACNSLQHTVESIKQFYCLIFLQSLREHMTQINGFKVIVYMSITLDALKLCTPKNMYLLYYGTQVILPGRFKSFHILNMNVTGRVVWKTISIFLPKKVRERVQIHAAYDALLDYFPRAVLPTKYGGDLKDYDMTEWLRKVSSPKELRWLYPLY